MKKKTRQDMLVEYLGEDIISGDSCLVAAAMSLMQCENICVENRDTEGLLRVANAWYSLGKVLMGISDHEEDKKPFGFGLVDMEDEEDYGDDENPSRIKVRKEFRKL